MSLVPFYRRIHLNGLFNHFHKSCSTKTTTMMDVGRLLGLVAEKNRKVPLLYGRNGLRNNLPKWVGEFKRVL